MLLADLTRDWWWTGFDIIEYKGIYTSSFLIGIPYVGPYLYVISSALCKSGLFAYVFLALSAAKQQPRLTRPPSGGSPTASARAPYSILGSSYGRTPPTDSPPFPLLNGTGSSSSDESAYDLIGSGCTDSLRDLESAARRDDLHQQLVFGHGYIYGYRPGPLVPNGGSIQQQQQPMSGKDEVDDEQKEEEVEVDDEEEGVDETYEEFFPMHPSADKGFVVRLLTALLCPAICLFAIAFYKFEAQYTSFFLVLPTAIFGHHT